MAVETRRRSEFARQLAASGYDDFLLLDRDSAARVLTEERKRLLDTLRETRFDSISALAGVLDRDVSAVHRDLDLLFEYGIVEYEAEGSRKRPRLKHEHVFVEPVV